MVHFIYVAIKIWIKIELIAELKEIIIAKMKVLDSFKTNGRSESQKCKRKEVNDDHGRLVFYFANESSNEIINDISN